MIGKSAGYERQCPSVVSILSSMTKRIGVASVVRLRIILWVLAPFALLASTSMAQDKSAVLPLATLVSLNSTDGLRGKRVILDLKLDAPQAVNVGSVENEISFPPKLVSFVSATRAPATAGMKAVIKTELKEDPGNPEKSIVKITISSPAAEKSPPGSLPNGVISNLSFQIAGDAEFGLVSLALKSKAWTNDIPAKPVPMVVNISGKIHVTEEGMFSCFFYMH